MRIPGMLAGSGAPVAIDGRAAVRPELGGVERWARELCVRLPRLDRGRYAIVAPRPRLAHRLGHAWEQAVLPLRAARGGARLLLCPANLAPVAAARASVVVVHDAAALRHPGWYAPAYVAWQRAVLPLVARRAAHVITVSEFSRAEVIELLGADPDRVSVVPGGVREDLRPDPAAAAAARAVLGLRRPYVLTVGSRTSRKNLGALALAGAALSAQGIHLVAAGGHRPQFAAEALAGVRDLGHVDDALLGGLYSGAEAFVLPSRYEGFGLPALEAMACGTPVIAADAAALPQTCGGAAVLVAPEPEPLRDALLDLLADEDRRAGLRAAGLERAASFPWRATAERVDAVVERLL